MNRLFLAAFVVAINLSPSLYAADQVAVEFVGETFPIRLEWSSGDEKGTLHRPGLLPAGEVTVDAQALHTNAFRVLVRYQMGDEPTSDIVAGPQKLTLKKDQVLRVTVSAVLPPPNAVVVPVKDSAIMVSWMYPEAILNPDDFTGKEKWRSTAMTLADPSLGGRKGVAQRLAAEALKNTPKEAGGNARGLDQVSVLQPVETDGSVAKELKDLTVDELSEAIERGLAALEFSWSGEMTRAKELLPQ